MSIYPPVPPGGHVLPPLPYPYTALEPVISRESLRIHHDSLHRNYVEALNKAELELARARQMNDFSLIRHWERELAYNGSGHILHSVFWTIMTAPGSGGQPGYHTARQIDYAFGSLVACRSQLSAAAVLVAGSGWGILAWNPAWNRLVILAAEDHENSTQWGSIPLLPVDVWEHAYYLDYPGNRAQFVRDWWHLVNWPAVENRFLLAMQGRLPLTL
ncbi:MAG: superoxide dismutase [bacterium]|jgi:Fe-Mn family superoxide dismutase